MCDGFLHITAGAQLIPIQPHGHCASIVINDTSITSLVDPWQPGQEVRGDADE